MPILQCTSFDTVREFSRQGKIIKDEVFVKLYILAEGSVNADSFYLDICNHLRISYPSTIHERDKEFFDVLKCRQNHLLSAQKFCASCFPCIRRCKFCAIEYDFKATLSSGQPQFLIEVWANLGYGQSPEDLKWKLPGAHGHQERLNFEPGSIRTKYELGHDVLLT